MALVLKFHSNQTSFSSQLLDSDQELYRNFPLTISERWQQEVTETVFDTVNAETDKVEARKRAKNKQLGHEEGEPHCGESRLPLALLLRPAGWFVLGVPPLASQFLPNLKWRVLKGHWLSEIPC